MRIPQKFALQNGLRATLRRAKDPKAMPIFDACLKADPHLKLLTDDAYAVQIRVKGQAIGVVYVTDKPDLIISLLERDMRVALQSAEFFIYGSQAHRYVIRLSSRPNSIMATTDPAAENLINAILHGMTPQMSALVFHRTEQRRRTS
jgi:hypothetical protein